MTVEDWVPSPCIRLCKLGDDGACIGCGRTPQDVLAWFDATPERKRAIRAAASSSAAPVTSIVISFVAPSPSRAICRASDSITSVTLASRASRSSRFGWSVTPAAPLASSTSVSFVEVSPSTDRRS